MTLDPKYGKFHHHNLMQSYSLLTCKHAPSHVVVSKHQWRCYYNTSIQCICWRLWTIYYTICTYNRVDTLHILKQKRTRYTQNIINHIRQIHQGWIEKKCKENQFYLFQEMTLTSASWALMEMADCSRWRVSHIRRVPSTEHDANTSASVGLHYIEGKQHSQMNTKQPQPTKEQDPITGK